MGMSSALDTFCGQSYGAKKYHMLGIHLQRAVIILLVVSIPLAFIWANSRYLLEAVGQDHQIAIEAGHYAQLLIPGLFAYGLLYSLLRFLQAQNIVFPMMITTAITTLLHLPLCWILVFKFGLGHPGAALATGVSYWSSNSAFLLLVWFGKSPEDTVSVKGNLLLNEFRPLMKET
ncbi:Protein DETOXIFICATION 16 [Bienertia sinuspersici]